MTALLRRACRLSLVVSAVLATTSLAQTTGFTATYSGQGSGSSTCNTTYKMSGEEPGTTGTYPVFIYMVGTNETYTNASAMAAVRGMAQRGYVAATVQYHSSAFGTCSQLSGKSKCIFDGGSATSAVGALCGRAKADCAKGLVVAGFSQGSILAVLAKNYNGSVQAAYGMGTGVKYSIYDLTSCVANGNRTLTSDRLRVVNGELDSFLGGNHSGVQAQTQTLTGKSCTSGATTCFNANGSGWQIVKSPQVTDGSADHCYMRSGGSGCSASQNTLDLGWQNGADSWQLNANLDWLTTFTAR